MTRDQIVYGTDNIFADIGLPNPEIHKLKAELVTQIRALVEERSLTQNAAGKVIGLSQPEISRIFRSHFSEVSIERLMGMLQKLDCDVDIVVHPNTGLLSERRIHFAAAE